MAVDVVHDLEVVEVGEHESELEVVARRARELPVERRLALAAVGEPGEAVDERLLLDDAVQPQVVERHGGLVPERVRREDVVGAEAGPQEPEHAEGSAPARERNLQLVPVRARVADLDELALGAHEAAAHGGRRLDRGLEDHPDELLEVVCRPERVGEAADGVAQPPPLGLELGETLLELARHLVERAREHGELVSPAHRDALPEPPPRDLVGGVHEPPHGADDRSTLEIGDRGDQEQRREQSGQQPALVARVGRVDPSLGREQREQRAAGAGERHGQRAVAVAAHPQLVREPGRDGELAPDAGVPGDDLRPPDEGEAVAGVDARAELELAHEHPVERHRRDDLSEAPVATDHSDGPSPGRRRQDADVEPVATEDDEIRLAAKERRERLPVAACERPREARIPCQPQCAPRRLTLALVVGGQRRAHPGLEARVDEPRLALGDDAAEAPEDRRERQHREQQKVENEPKFEAAHRIPLFTPSLAIDRSAFGHESDVRGCGHAEAEPVSPPGARRPRAHRVRHLAAPAPAAAQAGARRRAAARAAARDSGREARGGPTRRPAAPLIGDPALRRARL